VGLANCQLSQDFDYPCTAISRSALQVRRQLRPGERLPSSTSSQGNLLQTTIIAILGSIEVRIAQNISGRADSEDVGNALSEYQKPNTSVDQPSNPVEKYVEAVTGQPFQIEVFVKPGFQLYSADGIGVGIVIDDRVVTFNRYFSAEAVRQKIRDGKPVLISSVSRVEGNRRFRMGFTFGSLNLGEDRSHRRLTCSTDPYHR